MNNIFLQTSSTTSSVLEDLENSAELAAANFEVAKLDSDARPKSSLPTVTRFQVRN